MRRVVAIALVFAATTGLAAQAQRRPAAKPVPPPPPAAKPVPPPPAALQKVAPLVVCPTLLGVGVATKLRFCDVMSERDPAAGVLIPLPPHTGPVTLTFNLHNRHTYSEEQTKANRAYARYTATIGVLTMDNTLISRAVVQSEFRTVGDLVDRIGGGAGPGGVKAVAPTGSESVSIIIPEGEEQVSILGEKLIHERIDGSATYTSPGRPIAVISDLMVEFRPPPPPPPPQPVRKKK
jgi:hypothetical protein